MKHLRIAALALAGTAALAGCADDPVRPDMDAVRFSKSANPEGTGNHLVLFKAAAVPAGFVDRVAALGGKVEQAQAVLGEAIVSGLNAAGIAALKADKAVALVEPETVLQIPRVWPAAPAAVADALPASQANPATAVFYPRQWHLGAIGSDQAWAAGELGDPDITVAILDTGIGYIHPDLSGLVDLSRSVSFRPADDALVAALFPGRHPVADLHYHGTHVAATVASKAVAAAGVTSRTTLIGVKVCDVNGSCPSAAVFNGVVWAVEHGANIINLSVGGAFTRSGTKGYVSVINRIFNYAYEAGVSVVVSAGNEATNLDRPGIPSLYKTYCDTPNTLCVSATGPTAAAGVNGPWTNVDAWAGYSNYGRAAIDFAAPGGTVAAPVWAACSPFSLAVPVCQTGTFVVGIAGTSMASPHVAGLAAMIMGKYGPMSPAALRNRLLKSADDLGARGTDPYYGKGRINAARAVGL